MNLYIPKFQIPMISQQKNPLEKVLEKQITSENKDDHPRFQITENPKKADFFLLPNLWNYYIENHQVEEAIKVYEEATQNGKRLLLISEGDYTANMPFDNSVVIQSSGFKSRDGLRGTKLLGIPTFIDDYLSTYCNGNLQLREKKSIPTVGFCGQANGSFIDYSRRKVQIAVKQFRYKIGSFKWEPANIEPTRFRNKIIRRIQKTSGISSNMILRTKYRAGYRPKVKDPFHPSRLEFIQNILNSDYTICVRGGGNFSVRFYETLVLGRIPIFINTDCVMPLDEVVDYKKYMVWVEQDEIPYIGEKILDFHHSLSNEEFKTLQIECRNFWKNYLTFNGFFNRLPEVLENYKQ